MASINANKRLSRKIDERRTRATACTLARYTSAKAEINAPQAVARQLPIPISIRRSRPAGDASSRANPNYKQLLILIGGWKSGQRSRVREKERIMASPFLTLVPRARRSPPPFASVNRSRRPQSRCDLCLHAEHPHLHEDRASCRNSRCARKRPLLAPGKPPLAIEFSEFAIGRSRETPQNGNRYLARRAFRRRSSRERVSFVPPRTLKRTVRALRAIILDRQR